MGDRSDRVIASDGGHARLGKVPSTGEPHPPASVVVPATEDAHHLRPKLDQPEEVKPPRELLEVPERMNLRGARGGRRRGAA